MKKIKDSRVALKKDKNINSHIRMQLSQIKYPTDKDILVAIFMNNLFISGGLDRNSRIVPALFFQPHFPNMLYEIKVAANTGKTLLYSDQYESLRTSSLFQQFKYIKTFTPMRRITTSYAATVRFMQDESMQMGKGVMPDAISERVLNRSFMVDRNDRLYRDSVLVRFEDGKLNPKATFTALAEFLDIPYTESMTYCSSSEGINPESLKGNVRGFDTATVYRTYDEFANNDERAFIEYFMRDAYEYYGYDLQYYKGELVNDEWVKEKIKGFTCLNSFIARMWSELLRTSDKYKKNGVIDEATIQADIQRVLDDDDSNRLRIAYLLMAGLRFVNKQGQPLHMMTRLRLDPDLLEQPLYH